jgi:hypothetical protein
MILCFFLEAAEAHSALLLDMIVRVNENLKHDINVCTCSNKLGNCTQVVSAHRAKQLLFHFIKLSGAWVRPRLVSHSCAPARLVHPRQRHGLFCAAPAAPQLAEPC